MNTGVQLAIAVIFTSSSILPFVSALRFEPLKRVISVIIIKQMLL